MMESFFEAFQPGSHSYHPFGLDCSSQNCRPSLHSLQDWCKYTILQTTNLQNFRRVQRSLPLPDAIIHYLQSFTTDDFVQVESAPFLDVFDFNFYHRALSYKVHCKFDGCVYLATHGSNQSDLVDNDKLREKKLWINSFHENLMSIYGIVFDELTGNLFYIMNMPQVSLEHIQVMLFSSSLRVPEVELWTLAYQLTSALLYIHSFGLYYGSFGLENVFFVNNQIVLENELTRKSRYGENLWARIHQSTKRQNSNVKFSGVISPRQLNEAQSIWYLGFIMSKFASTNSGSPLLYPIEMPQSYLFYKRCVLLDSLKMYSPEFCQLIIDSQNPNLSKKLSLLWINNLAARMIMKLEGTTENRSGLLDMAKEEFYLQKQSNWR